MPGENEGRPEMAEEAQAQMDRDAILLQAYLNSLNEPERQQADEVMRLPGFTHADIYGAVREYRRNAEIHARLDKMDKQLSCMAEKLTEMATPTWKKAGYGLVGLALGAGAWWAERGVR